MSQATGINFKSIVSPGKRKRDRKIVVAFWVIALVPAVYFYCQYVDGLTHVRHPAKGAHIVSATGKSKLATSSPKGDDKTVSAKTDKPTPTKPASASFVDTLMSVFVPSAEAITLQPEMQPAHLAVKQLPAQQVTSSHEPPLTAAQKRLKVAQDGFGDAMSLAYQYPDHYGFGPDENLRAARLAHLCSSQRMNGFIPSFWTITSVSWCRSAMTGADMFWATAPADWPWSMKRF